MNAADHRGAWALRIPELGSRALSASELLALLVCGAADVPAALVREASDVLRQFSPDAGTEALRRIVTLSRGCKLPRIGDAAACVRIAAALEIAGRVSERAVPPVRVSSASGVYKWAKDAMQDVPHNHVRALLLNVWSDLLDVAVIGAGQFGETRFEPAQFFRPALAVGAIALIVVQNCRELIPSASKQDHALYARLCQAGKIVGVRVDDYLIAGAAGYFSMKEWGADSGSGES